MTVIIYIIAAIIQATLLAPYSLALSRDGMALLEIKNTLNDSHDILRNWNLSDSIPCQWTGITCHSNDYRVRSINLPYMKLRGTLSPSIAKLSRLQRLALHQNSLNGMIPKEIGNCKDLKAIYLRANQFHGRIPSKLGDLRHLTILDLSSNELKGEIPSSISRLNHLRFLNLSMNQFSGQIPRTATFDAFRMNSFLGNADLCGEQVRRICRDSLGFPAVLPHPGSEDADGSSTIRYLKGVIIGAVSAMVILLTALFLFLWIRLFSEKESGRMYTEMKKHVSNGSSTKFITFHGDLLYSTSEIMEKLESLDVEDIVGCGGFGTVYRMVMNDCATFAVKSIDGGGEGSDKIFERELEILGRIKHVNLVNLRGYCRLSTSKLLICDYVAGGSLDKILHDRNKQDEIALNWNSRLRIAMGSARGLAYLHDDCQPKIIHRDIKSSNILIDENLNPRVSDFGLARLQVDDEANTTTVVAGTFGYLAPEYLQSGIATEKSDVYSFGVLLLELVTGKRPTDQCFVEKGLNIVGWMNTGMRHSRMRDVIDRNCVDAEVRSVEALLDIAARCTDANPLNRPSMKQVLQQLEEETASSSCSDEIDSSPSV